MPTYSYSASKAAVHQLTRVLAKELGPRHVTVNAVAPGPFESKMMAATLESIGDRSPRPRRSAASAARTTWRASTVFLASRAGAYVTGAVIPVDGGLVTTT